MVIGAVSVFLLSSMLPSGAVVSNRPQYVPTHVLITLKPGYGMADLAAFRAKYGAQISQKLAIGNTYLLTLPSSTMYRTGSDPATLVANKKTLQNTYSCIQDVHLNHMLYPVDTPNDPYYSIGTIYTAGQWNLQSGHINAPQAWDIEKGSYSTVVAVIDVGIRTMNEYDSNGNLIRTPHPDLVDRLLPGKDITENGLDASPPEDDYIGMDMGHATHVAGIVGASTNNGLGVAGLTWNGTWILPIKVSRKNTPNMTDADLVNAIGYCISWRDSLHSPSGNPLKVNVINMSLGYVDSTGLGGDPLLGSACAEAANNGIVVVCAAGNDGPLPYGWSFYPAGFPSCIAVAATDSTDNMADFSSEYADVTDHGIAAPGVQILSTIFESPTWWVYMIEGGLGPKVTPDAQGNCYMEMDGTSMASPHVAAAAALVMSRGVPASDVKQILFTTATQDTTKYRWDFPNGATTAVPVPVVTYPNVGFGYGLLNVQAAVKKASIDSSIQLPVAGSTATTAASTFQINYRHALQSSVRIWIDGVLIAGPTAEKPTLIQTDNQSSWNTYWVYSSDDPTGTLGYGKGYLHFNYTLADGTHTVKTTATSELSTSVKMSPLTTQSQTTFNVSTSQLAMGWHMVSVPAQFSPAIPPEQWCTDKSSFLCRWNYAQGTGGQYATYRFDTKTAQAEASFAPPSVLSNNLVHPQSSGSATPPAGLGYWMYSGNPSGVTMPTGKGAAVSGPYVIGLYNGWNMVGDPYNAQLTWSNISVQRGTTKASLAVAEANGWIDDVAYRYNPLTGQYSLLSLSSGGYIMPYEAEWIRVNTSGPYGWPKPDIQLIIP
jgi:subtilisin family serine protease